MVIYSCKVIRGIFGSLRLFVGFFTAVGLFVGSLEL